MYISAGATVKIGTGSSGATPPAAVISDNGSLIFDTSTSVSPRQISGSGTVTQNGTGILFLGGSLGGEFSDTYTGGTTINAGIVELFSSAALGTGSVAIASAGTLNVNSFSPTIPSLTGSGTIDNNTAITTAPTVTIANTAADTFAGVIKNSANSLSLTKTGAGTLDLTGISTYSGLTTVSAGTLLIPAGAAIASNQGVSVSSGATLTLNGSITGAPPLNVSGIATFGANTGSGILARTFAGIDVLGGGSVAVAAPTAETSRTVVIDTALTTVGLFDLGANDMIIRGGGSAAVTQLTPQLAAESASGWTGTTGLTSSAAKTTADTTLGMVLNDNGGGSPWYTSFDNQTVADGDVLIKFTYAGDANLDGIVNGSDYTLIDNGFNNTLTGWHNGDFNYDGVVNGDDYTLIDNSFNNQGPALTANATEMRAHATAQIAVAVPEPMSLGLTSLCAIALSTRRRRPGKNS